MLKFRTKCTVRKNYCGLLWRVKFVTEADREGTLERFVNLETSLTQNCPISHLFTWCGMTNRYECLCTSTIVLPPKVVKCEKVDNFVCLLNRCQRWSTWLHICQNGAGVGHPKKLAATLARRGRSNNEQQGRDCTHLEMTFLLRPLVVSFMQLTALLGWVSMLHLYVHCTEMSSSERVF